ncbi:hypothetical protein B0H14DRAFT_2580121 [Mycena olivaceomarginata]|nr:hypothetical protein B0H14DRAFT_2580121 [Mycena olivaceomarginata]
MTRRVLISDVQPAYDAESTRIDGDMTISFEGIKNSQKWNFYRVAAGGKGPSNVRTLRFHLVGDKIRRRLLIHNFTGATWIFGAESFPERGQEHSVPWDDFGHRQSLRAGGVIRVVLEIGIGRVGNPYNSVAILASSEDETERPWVDHQHAAYAMTRQSVAKFQCSGGRICTVSRTFHGKKHMLNELASHSLYAFRPLLSPVIPWSKKLQRDYDPNIVEHRMPIVRRHLRVMLQCVGRSNPRIDHLEGSSQVLGALRLDRPAPFTSQRLLRDREAASGSQRITFAANLLPREQQRNSLRVHLQGTKASVLLQALHHAPRLGAARIRPPHVVEVTTGIHADNHWAVFDFPASVIFEPSVIDTDSVKATTTPQAVCKHSAQIGSFRLVAIVIVEILVLFAGFKYSYRRGTFELFSMRYPTSRYLTYFFFTLHWHYCSGSCFSPFDALALASSSENPPSFFGNPTIIDDISFLNGAANNLPQILGLGVLLGRDTDARCGNQHGKREWRQSCAVALAFFRVSIRVLSPTLMIVRRPHFGVRGAVQQRVRASARLPCPWNGPYDVLRARLGDLLEWGAAPAPCFFEHVISSIDGSKDVLTRTSFSLARTVPKFPRNHQAVPPRRLAADSFKTLGDSTYCLDSQPPTLISVVPQRVPLKDSKQFISSPSFSRYCPCRCCITICTGHSRLIHFSTGIPTLLHAISRSTQSTHSAWSSPLLFAVPFGISGITGSLVQLNQFDSACAHVLFSCWSRAFGKRKFEKSIENRHCDRLILGISVDPLDVRRASVLCVGALQYDMGIRRFARQGSKKLEGWR